MRKTTNFADNSVVLGVETPIKFAASEFFWTSNLLNSTHLRSIYLEYHLKYCVYIKVCVKIFIYCWVHKVYSDNHVKFIPQRFSFIGFCHLKLTATTIIIFKFASCFFLSIILVNVKCTIMIFVISSFQQTE